MKESEEQTKEDLPWYIRSPVPVAIVIVLVVGYLLNSGMGLLLIVLIPLGYWFYKNTMGKTELKCPRCGSTNLNQVKPGLKDKYMASSTMLFTGAGKISKTLNVCRDCSFSWEDR
jgi:hypothetical protein